MQTAPVRFLPIPIFASLFLAACADNSSHIVMQHGSSEDDHVIMGDSTHDRPIIDASNQQIFNAEQTPVADPSTVVIPTTMSPDASANTAPTTSPASAATPDSSSSPSPAAAPESQGTNSQ